MAQAQHLQSWSDLPTELAGLVLCRLPSYSDRVRFGAVCCHWSFSSAQHCLPPPLPCLAFPDGTFVCLPLVESFQFPDIASYHSCYGEWRVFLHNGTCSLKNPFSKVTLTLPNLCCHCPIDEPVEIINGRCNPEENMPQQSLDMSADMSIYKLIVCSKLLVVSIVSIRPRNTIALCRPGADSWLVSGLGNKRMLFDMVFSGGKLYVIDEDKDLLAIEIEEDSDSGKLRISQIKRLIEGPSFAISMVLNEVCMVTHFLVKCQGALLLVRRTIFSLLLDGDGESVALELARIEFKVFEANFNATQWVGVASVGDDHILFLGRNYCQSICMSHYKIRGDMLKGNRIMYLDDGSCRWFQKGTISSLAAYDLSDGKTYMLDPPGLFEGRKAPSWLFPQ